MDTIVSEINKGNYFVYLDNYEIVGILCLKNMFNNLHISVIAVKAIPQLQSIDKKLIDFAKDIAKSRNQGITVNSFNDYNAI